MWGGVWWTHHTPLESGFACLAVGYDDTQQPNVLDGARAAVESTGTAALALTIGFQSIVKKARGRAPRATKKGLPLRGQHPASFQDAALSGAGHV